jgi:hypothetical protein
MIRPVRHIHIINNHLIEKNFIRSVTQVISFKYATSNKQPIEHWKSIKIVMLADRRSLPLQQSGLLCVLY